MTHTVGTGAAPDGSPVHGPETGAASRDPASRGPEDGAKRPVRGALVKVLLHRRTERGMTLEPYPSRCVRRGEIHELVTTDHHRTAPGSRIDRVGFLGFVELEAGGVLDRGDRCWIGDTLVGVVLGFDACHHPNHYNVLITADTLLTGGDLALCPETPVVFLPPPGR